MPSCPRCKAPNAWVPGADGTDRCRICVHVDYHNPIPAELRSAREPQFRSWKWQRQKARRGTATRDE